MNRYVSTYRQDDSGSQVSCARSLPSSQITSCEVPRRITCTCKDSRKALEQLLQMCGESDDRSRTGHMERPLKLYLVKDKAKSKMPAEKCLDPCGEFRDERPARVDAARWKTTYQRDYSDPGAARLARRDKPSTTDERDSQQLQCCLPVKIIIQPDIRPHCSSDLSRNDKSPRAKIHDYSRKNIPRCGKKREDDDGGPLLPWKSEYQESIDKLGHNIIKAKLHHTKTKVIPVYITSN